MPAHPNRSKQGAGKVVYIDDLSVYTHDPGAIEDLEALTAMPAPALAIG